MKIYVKIAGMFASAVLCFGMAHVASAHVIVHPSEAGVASYQTFDMSVPVEKDFPTVALKLLIPDGVTNISPTVKPGWTIDVKKDENGNATEIDWTGGSIPVGERDDFTFSGKVPAAATTLAWKAYQTYSDGTIVSWDAAPSSENVSDSETQGPYSQTSVIDDLSSSSSAPAAPSDALGVIALAVAACALAIAWVAFFMAKKRGA